MSFLVSEKDYDMVGEKFYITVAFQHLIMQDMSTKMSYFRLWISQLISDAPKCFYVLDEGCWS